VDARRERAREEQFQTAFGYLRPLLSQPSNDSTALLLAAELHAEHAAWLAKTGRSPEQDLRGGLARADEALSKNPHHPEALLIKGRLLLERARLSRTQQSRAEDALRAKEMFEAALQQNPLLARELSGVLREAEQLVR
jgi:hypothetical protein